VLFAFIGNGACSTVQKLQQIASGGRYKNEMMILALLIVITVMVLLAGCTERKQALDHLKIGARYFILCGAANGAVNLLVMILSGRMPVSLMFPIISAGGIVATFIISTVFYKEKLSRPQLVGFILGTVSVVLLNF
jgi:multidrug transporter EmrE-like cation transporter